MNPDFKLDRPPVNLQSPLLELRDYYEAVVEEYEQLAALAREKLAHVEALLEGWGVRDYNDLETTDKVLDGESSRAVREPDLALHNGKVLVASLHQSVNDAPPPRYEQELTRSLNGYPVPTSPDQIQGSPISDIDATALDETTPEGAESYPTPKGDDHKIDSDNSVEESAHQPVESITANPDDDSIKMLPPYQGLTRFEAIQKVLTDHKGTILHIDFIVRELYGELKPEEFKVIKPQIGTGLSHGKVRKMWSSIPDSKGCYTLDLSLVTPEETQQVVDKYNQTSTRTTRNPSDNISMLPAYQEMSVMQAISKFLQEQKGKVLHINAITKGLYGEVEGPLIKKAKHIVTNRLSKGKLEGRWDGIPKKPGYYTWKLRLL